MTKLFLTILQMSLMAAGVTVIVLPLRWLFRRVRLPALACVLLWLVVALRMVLPVGLMTSAFSLMGWLSPAVEERVDALARMEPAAAPPTTAAPAETADGGAAAAPEEQPAAPSFSIPEAAPDPEMQTEPEGLSLPDILARVWLAGVIAVWGYTLFSWLRTRALLSTAVRKGSIREGWWWESDRIPTAFVFGVIRPRVYVPSGLEGENLRWVRLHEESHIELGHSRCKLIYFLIMGVHWFNPVLWLSWVLLVRDLEVECDERVLKACGSPREYSAALLALASPRRGPLLPPGFGETGVKDRIKRALKWKPAARWATVVVAVLGTLLVFTLAADPTFPDASINGQYPILRVHLETDDTEGAEVVNMGAPENAPWPETLPETTCTAATPSPWVDLYLDYGQFPDQWVMTEYLVEDGTAVNPREVELSPYGAENGFLLRVEPREDAPGTGMETRVYVLSCTWRSGVLRSHTLEYAFRLTLPSVPPGPLTEPVVVAGDQRVDFTGDASVVAAIGTFLHVTLPDDVTAYTLEGGGAAYGATVTLSKGGGGGSFGIRLEYLGGRAQGDPSDQTQRYTLTCTWADGSQSDHAFTVYAYTPRPEWDAENLRIRYPGDTEWTNLDALIPVPAEWANQDLAGRNEATDLVGLLTGTGGMVDGLNGWFVFTIGRGTANADTYVYRTYDGGRTWAETGRPDPREIYWYPSCTYFINNLVGFIGQSSFNGYPVFRTTDGGESWERITLPLSDESWELSKMYASGSGVLAVMTGYRSGEPESAVLFSRDAGETWEILELPQARYSELGELTVSPEQWLDAPVRLLGALSDGSAALYGLNPEETGLNGLLVEWNGSLSYFSNLTYNTGPQIIFSGLSLDDCDGDGADELAAATCTGTGTGVSSWRLDLFEWGDGVTAGTALGPILADSLTEEELAAQINAAVDSTYDPEARSYLLQTGVETWTADLSGEDAGAPLGGPVVCGSWFQYELEEHLAVYALLYPRGMPMTAVAAYASHVNYEDGLLELNTATGTLTPDGDYPLTLQPPEAPATPISDPEAILPDELPWPSYEVEGEFWPDNYNWHEAPVKLIGLSNDRDRTAAVFCFDVHETGQEGLMLCVGGHLAYFPELTYQVTPQVHPANPVWGDFDGDGADELAVIPTPGTGTGVLMQDLYVFEWDGAELTLGGAIDAYEVVDMDLGLPANRRVGSHVRFWAEGDTLRTEIDVEDTAGVPTLSTVAYLTGPVTYDETGLTLRGLAYTISEGG